MNKHNGVQLNETLNKRFESLIKDSYSERFMYGRFGVVSREYVLCQGWLSQLSRTVLFVAFLSVSRSS